MSGPYFLEILNRNGDVKERHRLLSLPIRIGRAYDNDVILDDPHSATHHAQILANEQGELVVRDLESKNGLVSQNQRHQELALDGNRVFRLGHSSLRLRTADFQVAAELADETNHNWEGWPPALLGLLLVALFILGRRWLFNNEENNPIIYLMTLGTALGIAILWAGAWAFINRMFEGHHRLGRHLFIAGCGYAAVEIWALLSNILGYAFSLPFFTGYGNLLEILIVVLTLYYHLNTVHSRHPRRIQLICLSLLVVFWGNGLMSNYQRTNILTDELYMSQLLPPAFQVAPTHSLDTFFSAAQNLKEKADQASRKPLRGSNDGEQN
jgi:pSer/pThr/pTyr-binding forkhead associated (FHA) protein